MKTKKFIYYSLFLAIIFGAFISCSDDDDDNYPKLTNESGKPSRFNISSATTGNRDIYLYYTGNLLSKKRDISKTENALFMTNQFQYLNNQLASIYSFIENKDVADGSSSTVFKESTDKKSILVEVSATPSSLVEKFLIELSDSGMPTKITEEGSYTSGHDNQVVKIGQYYALFEYDTSKNIVKQTVYSIENGEVAETYKYEYDTNIGVLSKIDLPTWYYVYMNFLGRNSNELSSRLYLNYSNNIIKETTSQNEVYSYGYTYNEAKAPTSMTLTTSTISITY